MQGILVRTFGQRLGHFHFMLLYDWGFPEENIKFQKLLGVYVQTQSILETDWEYFRGGTWLEDVQVTFSKIFIILLTV